MRKVLCNSLLKFSHNTDHSLTFDTRMKRCTITHARCIFLAWRIEDYILPIVLLGEFADNQVMHELAVLHATLDMHNYMALHSDLSELGFHACRVKKLIMMVCAKAEFNDNSV